MYWGDQGRITGWNVIWIGRVGRVKCYLFTHCQINRGQRKLAVACRIWRRQYEKTQLFDESGTGLSWFSTVVEHGLENEFVALLK